MLEKRRSRGNGGGGGGTSIEDNWDAPPLVKAKMAFEIIWFCFILYLITVLLKVIRNVPSPQRQPYILLLISAIFLDIALITHAIIIRVAEYIPPGSLAIALSSVLDLLWNQSELLITMAGLWVFRKRSKLIMYGEGAKAFPYAGQKWKFIVDWVVTSLSLLFLSLMVIVDAAAYTLIWDDAISHLEYRRLLDARTKLYYVQFAFYSILTIIFVVTGFTLSGAFKRKMGLPDVVRTSLPVWGLLLTSVQVTNQMLIWVMPWLVIRAIECLSDIIIRGTGKRGITYDSLSLALATVIVNGACWCMVLYGFIKTATDPAPWDWSHLQANQPGMARYSVQVGPEQPAHYAPPNGNGAPQGWWGQNNNPQQQVYQSYAPPPVKV